jgi:hypothetical protein
MTDLARLFVSPLDGAIVQLRAVWDRALNLGPQAADK